MRIGIVGRGYWGDTYARILKTLDISYWQLGTDWTLHADGLIVACKSDAHYEVARHALLHGVPVLVEKPVCLVPSEVEDLISLGGIALAGHTRLYDPAWLPFKGSKPSRVSCFAGGVTESNPDPEWNWYPHLVAMCADAGFDPDNAYFDVTRERQPLRFVADGREFRDTHGALPNLVMAFVRAIKKGEPDNEGLRVGLKTIQFMERLKRESGGLHQR